MRSRIIIVIFSLLFLPQFAFAVTGRELMEENKKHPVPDSAESKMKMVIHDGGRTEEKEFTAYAKKSPDGENKVLVSFHKPTRIKLLTHAHKNRDDDQWLVLSSGRLKRVVSSDKGKPFVHSHYYYEDLSSREIDEYTYTYLGDETAVGVDCYKVESIRKADAEKVYDKIDLYLRKSDHFIVRLDFYQNGKLHKYLENHDIRKVDDFLTPFRMVMTLANGNDHTEMTVEQVDYNKPISDAKFNKETLR